MRNTSRVSQPLRALAAASTATFVALFSHVIAGGAPPTLLGVVLPLLISLLVCSLLAGRTLSLTRVTLSVIASQALFHVSFVLSALLAGTPLSHAHHAHGGGFGVGDGGMSGVGGVGDGGVGGVSGISGANGSANGLLLAMHGDAVMWIMHLIAAAITIFALYRGEQALLQLKRASQQLGAWLFAGWNAGNAQPVAATVLQIGVVSQPQTSSLTLSRMHGSTLTWRGPPSAH